MIIMTIRIMVINNKRGVSLMRKSFIAAFIFSIAFILNPFFPDSTVLAKKNDPPPPLLPLLNPIPEKLGKEW